ncbi:DgyrCDS10137 [Dimorphilus gyrociliatus]|uniref:DgyrCDS10137 n=1 Tax=Dimorphilus gyrociliatus TaxID=2664684 RepID=A0A7I8W4D5_9ANNE|nr:DgyrCDS10137 [Dimorphilus gyrociliatus]
MNNRNKQLSFCILHNHFYRLLLACGSFAIDNGQPKPNTKTMQIDYTCYSNYKLNGSSTVYCNSETRKFEPAKPECIPSNLPTNETKFWNWARIFLENHLWEGDYSYEISSSVTSNAEPFPRINQRWDEPITLKVLSRGEKIDDFYFVLSVDDHRPILLTASEDPSDKMKLIFRSENLTESHAIFPKNDWKLELTKYISDDKWEFLGDINTLKYGNCPIKLYQPKLTVGESIGVTGSPPIISTGGIIGIALAGFAVVVLLVFIAFIRFRNRESVCENNSGYNDSRFLI